MSNTNEKIELMKVILDENKSQVIEFIGQSTAEAIYDSIHLFSAFDLGYQILRDESYTTEENAELIVANPSILSDMLRRFSDDEDADLSVDYMIKLIDSILEEYKRK